jgi:hypothetical protein
MAPVPLRGHHDRVRAGKLQSVYLCRLAFSFE